MAEPEWGFAEPPELVDIDRIWNELSDLGPAMYQYAYLGSLRLKAPQTYERLRQKRLAAGCTIFAWPPSTVNGDA